MSIWSAIPAHLAAYSARGKQHGADLDAAGRRLQAVLDRFARSRPDPAIVPAVPPLGDRLRRFAGDKSATDHWVGMVGDAFERAGGGGPDQSVEQTGVTIVDMNVGQGHKNVVKPWEDASEGTDPGDMDEIARRIVDGHADVATLQEVFFKDSASLKLALEQQTGDEWDIYFGTASHKWQENDNWTHTMYPNMAFGQLIAVRHGTGITSSEKVARRKLDEPGDDGSDGRAMLQVRLHLENGGVLDVATAHTDYDGVTEDAMGQQVRDVRTIAERLSGGGPLVVTGDFNHTIRDHNPSGDALREFTDEGYSDAGNIGRTSEYGHGRRIDYVFVQDGLHSGTPHRVQGDSPDHRGEDHDASDHDGISVTVDVPPRS